MKRAGIVLSLSILMMLLSFTTCFASGLKLEDSYPQNDSHGSMVENVMVKLYFNEDVSAKEVQQANKEAFRFTDAKGKEVKLRILYPEESKQIWVLVEKTLNPILNIRFKFPGILRFPMETLLVRMRQ